ncbi:hypothetical protein [Streptomyces sp. NRRL F-5755]|uniref:hypothetical protein n=1 Tax=Streptomyces sp. NRRL F-5755 TaxID=1519475 RepID=UPI0013313D21|nr:hypothetical protein [Streptomyces sp. NRRL F-5755]
MQQILLHAQRQSTLMMFRWLPAGADVERVVDDRRVASGEGSPEADVEDRGAQFVVESQGVQAPAVDGHLHGWGVGVVQLVVRGQVPYAVTRGLYDVLTV